MRSEERSRREFLKLGASLAAAAAAPGAYVEVFAQGIRRLSQGLLRVLWLQGQACSGCTVSLFNADSPTILQAITERVALAFHPTISAAQGRLAMDVIGKVQRSSEPFVLVVEGAIPVRMPEACRIAGRSFAEILPPLLRRAQWIVAAGNCASFGGIPSAEGSVTGAAGARDLMDASGMATQRRLVHCPGCPCHPAELLGTLAHLAAKGYPEVKPTTFIPAIFSAHCLHDECPRLPQFNARVFAMQFGDGDGCLYQLGCRGLDVSADCQRRAWNGGVNWCIPASAPCIGCNQSHFGKTRAFPFYNKDSAPPG